MMCKKLEVKECIPLLPKLIEYGVLTCYHDKTYKLPGGRCQCREYFSQIILQRKALYLFGITLRLPKIRENPFHLSSCCRALLSHLQPVSLSVRCSDVPKGGGHGGHGPSLSALRGALRPRNIFLTLDKTFTRNKN